MVGMAWTLHPALVYEKYGSVLVQLWDSGLLRTVFRPFQRLSASLSTAAGSGVGGSRQVNTESGEGSSPSSLFSEGTPVTKDVGFSTAVRDAVEMSEEPSTSQRNEPIFQEDMHAKRRRQRKQGKKLKGTREVRKKATSSTSVKQSRGGSIVAHRGGKMMMTAGTPMADLQDALPRKTTLGIAEPANPGLPVETESESAVSSHTSSADKVSDDDDDGTGRRFKPPHRELQSASGMPGEHGPTGPTSMSQKNDVESPSNPGLEYSVVAAGKKKKAQSSVQSGIQQEGPWKPGKGVLVPPYMPNRDVSISKKKGRRAAKQKTSPSVAASLQPVAHANSKDDIPGPPDLSRSVQSALKIVTGGSPVFSPLEKKGQNAATLGLPRHKRKGREHAQRSGSPKVHTASTEISSGATAKGHNDSRDVLTGRRKNRRSRKKQASPENGGTSTKSEIHSEPRDQASSEASVPHRRGKGPNEMPTAEPAEVGVDLIKPRLDEEWRNSSEKLLYADASNSKRSRKGAKNKSSPKAYVAPLGPGPDAALTNLLQMTLDNEASKRKRNRQRDIKSQDLPKGAAALTGHRQETGPKDGVQALSNVDTSKHKDEPHVDTNSLSWTKVDTASKELTIKVDLSDASKWSSPAAVSKHKEKSKKSDKSPASSKVTAAPMESIPEVDGEESARHISSDVKSKSKATFHRGIKNLVTSIGMAFDASARRSLRSCENTDVSKRKGEAPEDTNGSTLTEVRVTSMEHGVEAGSTGLRPVPPGVDIAENKSRSQKCIRAFGSPEIGAVSVEPGLDQGSRRQPPVALDAEASRNKIRGGKDSNSVEHSVTSMEPGHEPASRNSLQTLPDVNLSTCSGLGHDDTNIADSTLGQTRINFGVDMDLRDSSQTSVISQASKRDERPFSAYVLPGKSGLYESSRAFSGTTANYEKFQTGEEDTFFPGRADEPSPSDGRSMRLRRDGTDVVPATMPSPSRASVERCKVLDNPLACFLLSCSLASDIKPDSDGVNSGSAGGTSTNEVSNDRYASRDDQRARTASIFGALRHPLLKSNNGYGAHPPREAQRSPNEQWPAWLTKNLDKQRTVPRTPEDQRLRQRLAAWDPFQEETYALTGPNQLDLLNKEPSDADLSLRLRHENKRKASLSMVGLCACSTCIPYIRSKGLPMHATTPDQDFYEDMHWITESTGGSLAASSDQQLPFALARSSDVSSATSGLEEHRALKSLLPHGPAKVAAADDIAETLPYTVQKCRRRNRSATSLQAAMDGWASYSGTSESKSIKGPCRVFPEGAQPEREWQVRPKTNRPTVHAEWVHPTETGAATGPSSSAVQRPRPEDCVQEEASTRNGTYTAANTLEARKPLRRRKVGHTKAHKKRSTKRKEKRKKREPPHDHHHRAPEDDAEDNNPAHDGDVGSAVTAASPDPTSHVSRRMIAWRRSDDHDESSAGLAFNDADYMDFSPSGEVTVCINMTTTKQRSMIWPF